MTKATITVQAAAQHPDVLDIRDAMQQILDFFDILSADGAGESVTWKIVAASMNSPFTATAEAVSDRIGVDVTPIAYARISEASNYLTALARGQTPHNQLGPRRRRAAVKLLRRNVEKIGKTVVAFDHPKAEAVVLTPTFAATALETAAKLDALELSYMPDKRDRVEHGTVEGRLVDVGTDYNQPAIRIIERKSGRQIACRVDRSMMDTITRSTSFKDVWEHKRVAVRGKIVFDAHGQISKIYARSVSPISPRSMTLKDIEDRGFTRGLGTLDYLENLREGDFG